MSSETVTAVAPQRVHPVLRFWHVLSLDAPTVCAVWCAAIAVQNHLRLPWHVLAAVWTAVWMIYAADRLLDLRDRDSRRTTLQHRHLFTAEHRPMFLSAITVAAGALAALLVYDLSFAARPRLVGVMWLGIGLAAYFAVEHFAPRRIVRRWAPWKNAAMVALLGAAVALPTAAATRAAWLWPETAALAFACWLNCRLIAAWEAEEPPLPRLPGMALGALLAGCAAAVVFTHASLFATTAASVALLFSLNHLRARFSPLALRVYADLALLAPALTLLRR